MNAPRVSDVSVNEILNKIRAGGVVNMYFFEAVLNDLKDARAQLKTQQVLRQMHNKEPE